MFIINYRDENGFMVFSALKDFQPILAFSETGSFKLSNLESSVAKEWLNQMKSDIAAVDELPDSIKFNNRLRWSMLIDKKSN